jgi:hypothetical protein
MTKHPNRFPVYSVTDSPEPHVAVPLRQAWREELEDRDVFNPETRDHVPAFLKGDVFELFFQPPDSEAYWELHVGPDAQIQQIRIPSPEAFARIREQGIPGEWMLRDPRMVVQSRIDRNCWNLDLNIPFSLFQRPFLASGERWKVSFCRYDHNLDPNSCFLSSTSSINALNFHNLSEWMIGLLV